VNLPFTVEQFFDSFARYHGGVWPAPLVLNALALAAVALVFMDRPSSGRWICAILASLWAWVAVAYHFTSFAVINPAAWLFGAASLAGSLWLAWVGVAKGRLQFTFDGGLRSRAGVALVVFALVLYPLVGHLLGHRYPAVPTFGLPCPTTIFTIGILLFGKAPVPASVFVVPILWAMVGSAAAFTLGVYQDLGLLAAGVMGAIAVMGQWPRAKARPALRVVNDAPSTRLYRRGEPRNRRGSER
jgi:hypothetical protein